MMGGIGMPPLRRHQLAYLTEAGWLELHKAGWDAPARLCLSRWSERRLPLVVTRQDAAPRATAIRLGLPAPADYGRRRIAVEVASSGIRLLDEFPRLRMIEPLLPRSARIPCGKLVQHLDALRLSARVYGSFGWQLLTRQQYVHSESDLDLWVQVESIEQADAAASLLEETSLSGMRLDGELLFTDGSGVNWREWKKWRSGAVRGVLVKRLDGASIERKVWTPCFN